MEKKIKSFKEFKLELETNPKVQEEFKADPVTAIQKFESENPLTFDSWIYRATVLALGVTIILIIVGVIVLTAIGVVENDQNVLTILTAVSSAAIGALAGLLRPPAQQSN